jgi:pyruvate/2-oxoglutarate dehydrogenase complex dihydrolipoamide dehydrogenase (E3) component
MRVLDVRPYEALGEARRIRGAREAVNGGLDVAAVLRRRDEIIGAGENGGASDDADLMSWVATHRITLVRGRGRLTGERRVMVGDHELKARRAVILAGGTVPLIPAIEGLEQVESLRTNRDATTADQIPGRMVIVGGGPVGVEMAQAFQTLGSQVTLIEGEHPVAVCGRRHQRPCAVHAHGQVPGAPCRGPDPRSRARRSSRRRRPSGAARDLHRPQIGSVGHTTETATRAGIEFDVYDTETSGNLGGLFYAPGAPGTTRFIVDRRRRVLLGCTITGSEIADFLHAATIAVAAEVPLERLRHAVPPFPTRSEIWLSLLVQAGV